ncbi:hypothetical protein EDD16DRAFT_1581689, partial [Pisolithus croceorrhizus]
STRSASTSSMSSLHNSPTISSPATSHPDHLVTNVVPRKRSSSPAERTLPDATPSFTSLVKPLSHVYLGDRDAGQRNLQGLQRSDGLPRLPGFRKASEASERSLTAGPVIRRPSPKGDGEAWEKVTDCQYTSKKQLVKRHVETTHLRFKPFVCEVCKKGFPQKTSLDTHMHGQYVSNSPIAYFPWKTRPLTFRNSLALAPHLMLAVMSVECHSKIQHADTGTW